MGLIYIQLLVIYTMYVLLCSGSERMDDYALADVKGTMDVLRGQCLTYNARNGWWSYRWCHEQSVSQLHFHRRNKEPSEVNHIGDYISNGSNELDHFYESPTAECIPPDSDIAIKRSAAVSIHCCRYKDRNHKHKRVDTRLGTFIDDVEETDPCHYKLEICSELVCDRARLKELDDARDRERRSKYPPKPPPSIQDVIRMNPLPLPTEEQSAGNSKAEPASHTTSRVLNASQVPHISPVSEQEQMELRERVRSMFYHGYDSYMKHAFPKAELKPLSCAGGKFDLIKIPAVTLMDTLDTLVVLGNHSEFRKAVGLISQEIESFNFDVSVSVFETTIRILGGLLSAHLMAVDPELAIYADGGYDGRLLDLAVDLGDRLMPAFRTVTGIPYGTVNLLRGVPKGETELASTAGAGSLVLEFEVLSCLSGDPKYGAAAMKAAEALFQRRSALGLLGKHIHVRSGKWHETLSGVGSNSDSFYEYLLKAYLLFRRKDYYHMFTEVYHAVKKHSMSGDWFIDVDMFSGKLRKKRSENLQAFWPGMEAMLGLTDSSARLLNAFYIVWSDVGFLPEEFDYVQWTPGKAGLVSQLYPLRPELVESTYLHYRSTGDRSWLSAGREFLRSLEMHTKTECGYATVKDVTTRALEDSMPSFFLSETCKYLFLLFDENNFVHNRGYIFSTEAHPFDPMQLFECSDVSAKTPPRESEGYYDFFDRLLSHFTGADPDDDIYRPSMEGGEDDTEGVIEVGNTDEEYIAWKEGKSLHSIHLQCPKRYWWNYSPYQHAGSLVSVEGAGEGTDNPTNVFDLASLLNLMHKKADPFDPRSICPIGDEPVTPSAPGGEGVEKVVEVNVGKLGTFLVHVYLDGFIINSLKYGNTIEIAGVGQPSVFVKEFNTTHSSTVVASMDGTISTCNIHMNAYWPEVNSDAGKNVWGSKKFDKQFVPSELEKKRCCSIASFGPTGHISTFPQEPVVGAPHYSTDTKSCHSPHKVKTTIVNADGSERVPDAKDSSTDGAELEPEPSRGWFNWGSKKATKQEYSLPYGGKVLLADRGDCMFEEKVINAEDGGAKGVIVVNTEPNLFMMSGMNTGSTEASPVEKTQASRATSSKIGSTTIPAVMVSNSDGKFIIDAMEYLHRKDVRTEVVMDMENIPTILDSAYMGYRDHSNIRMGENLIHILGQGKWGAALSKTDNREWQLYIVPTTELAGHVPYSVTTTRGQQVTTNNIFSFNSVDIYQRMISEQCPSHIYVDKNDVQLIKD